jgi:hypothetical protein
MRARMLALTSIMKKRKLRYDTTIGKESRTELDHPAKQAVSRLYMVPDSDSHVFLRSLIVF